MSPDPSPAVGGAQAGAGAEVPEALGDRRYWYDRACRAERDAATARRERDAVLPEPDDRCTRCGGHGRYAYGSTATWRGGIGGQAITEDVCDRCWGTGRESKHGRDLRALSRELEALRRQVAALASPPAGAARTGEEAGSVTVLPDGSAFAVASFPLPRDHWLTVEGYNVAPMPWRVGEGPLRDRLAEQVRAAARYAIRASTMNGAESDFDPDAMVQNMVVGLLGKWSADGLSSDDWANPVPVPPLVIGEPLRAQPTPPAPGHPDAAALRRAFVTGVAARHAWDRGHSEPWDAHSARLLGVVGVGDNGPYASTAQRVAATYFPATTPTPPARGEGA